MVSKNTKQNKVVADRWFSVAEIAEYLGISTDTVYNWINSKQMPGHKVGRFWKFKTSEIDCWIRGQDKKTTPD